MCEGGSRGGKVGEEAVPDDVVLKLRARGLDLPCREEPEGGALEPRGSWAVDLSAAEIQCM